MSTAVLELPKLSKGAIRCWKLLDWCRRKLKAVHPSIEWICAALSKFSKISRRSVLRYIATLKANGFLQVVRQGRSSARYVVSSFEKWHLEQEKVAPREAKSGTSNDGYLFTELKTEVKPEETHRVREEIRPMELKDASVLDPQWIEFRKAFEQNKPDTIPEDFMVAQHAWRVLDYLQKAQALAAVKARGARGMVIWCSPVTFLRSEYKRPLIETTRRMSIAEQVIAERGPNDY